MVRSSGLREPFGGLLPGDSSDRGVADPVAAAHVADRMVLTDDIIFVGSVSDGVINY
jgi:hypothetical protein